MANSPEEHHFHQHDAIKSGIKGSLVGGGAGLITSAVQNSLAKRNVGAFGVFTRTGGTVAMFSTSFSGLIGGTPPNEYWRRRRRRKHSRRSSKRSIG